MKGLHMLEDVDSVWSAVAKQEEREGVQVVTEANIASVNLALEKQAKILVDMRGHLRHELAMQTVASKSRYGWKAVQWKEASKVYDKALIGIDEGDVSKAEKQVLSDLAAARARARGSVESSTSNSDCSGAEEKEEMKGSDSDSDSD